jgi:hypothetical protein
MVSNATILRVGGCDMDVKSYRKRYFAGVFEEVDFPSKSTPLRRRWRKGSSVLRWNEPCRRLKADPSSNSTFFQSYSLPPLCSVLSPAILCENPSRSQNPLLLTLSELLKTVTVTLLIFQDTEHCSSLYQIDGAARVAFES